MILSVALASPFQPYFQFLSNSSNEPSTGPTAPSSAKSEIRVDAVLAGHLVPLKRSPIESALLQR